jgi:isocitrate/isopropylmalate dehydrogenase
MVIPGDGIGGEVVPVAVALLRTVVPKLRTTDRQAGFAYWEVHGVSMPPDLIDEARRHDGILFGATGTPAPPPPSYESPILALRKELNLHASIRYFRSSRANSMDLVIVRDISEGLYIAVERETPSGMIAEHHVTRLGTERLARIAAGLARRRNGRVTVVHKANVLRRTEGLFLEVAAEVLESEGIAWDGALADAAGYHLVMDPQKYDVMMANSHFGDLLSDVAAALAGGLGLIPSLTVGEGPPLAEPVHGSAPDIAGQDKADPVATVLSGCELLDHLGVAGPARRLRDATEAHLRARDKEARSMTTSGIAADIARRLDSA